MKWSHQSLILAFDVLEKKIGHQPTKKDWLKDSDTPSDMPVRKMFGNWTNFLLEVNRNPIKWMPSVNGFTRKGVRNKSHKRRKNIYGYMEIILITRRNKLIQDKMTELGYENE